MKKIIFTDNLDFLKKHIKENAEDLRFFMLKESTESFRIKKYISEVLHVRGITKREMLGRFGENFKSDFSKAVLNINKANDSVDWWAMNFTSKLPAMSKLYENYFYFASIKKITGDFDNLIVISDSAILSRQLKAWSVRAGIEFISGISSRFDIKKFLKNRTPLMIGYMFLKIAARKFISIALLEKKSSLNDKSALIVTQFEDRSILRNGLYHDIYLCDIKKLLSDLLSMKPSSFLTVGFSPYNFLGFIVKLAGRKENKDIYPMEYFLSIRKLLPQFILSLKRFFRPVKFKGSFLITGEDASILIEEEIKESVSSGQFLLNLSAYISMSSFSKIHDTEILYYPFENRSWEKMVILAFRKNSPATKIAGYQHTVIGPRHLCYFMEQDECSEIPMPDKIITDGEITKNIMKDWNFPENVLKTGCALRFSMPQKINSQRARSKIKNILVPLTTGMDEYVKMFMFLEEAFGGDEFYNIIIRPHPTVSFSKVFKIFTPAELKYQVSNATVKDDLDNCDIVLYAASTMSLEALAIGKPVIHIEFDDYLNSDPIFGMDIMKWKCGDPEKIIDLIHDIDSMDESDIDCMRLEAAEYTKKYFYPITKENMAEFLI